MHNWMRQEPIESTIERLGRSGYDAIEISGEPTVWDTGEVAGLFEKHGVGCWGSVTLMTGGRDLLHEDPYVRRGSIEYVKDTMSQIAEWGGKILTVVPSTVGKVTPMASPEEEWTWAVESLKECQEHAEQVGVRIGLEPLNRFETYFLNRADQALALAEDVGGNCGVCRHVPHEHRGGRLGAGAAARRRQARGRARGRQQPHALRPGRRRLGPLHGRARRGRLRRLRDG